MTDEQDSRQPADEPPEAAEQRPAPPDDEVEDASADSFPASDPPSFTESTATRNPGDD